MKRTLLLSVLVLLAALGARPARALTLQDCLAAARQDHPSLRAAQLRLVSAVRALAQARSAYYPQLKAGATYARTDNPPQAFMMVLNQRTLTLDSNFNEPEDTENLRLSAGVAWRLFDPVRGLTQDQSALGAAAREQQRRAVWNQLTHEITRAYFSALKARAFVAVQEASVSSITGSLAMARARLDAGSALKTDVLNLEVHLAEAEESLIRARNGYALAVAALNAAVGREMASPDAEWSDEPIRVPPADAEAFRATARPEYQALAALARIKYVEWQKTRRSYWPAVSGFGSLDWDRELSSDFEQSYFAGVAAEVEVFDGFRRARGSAAAKAEYEAAAADLEQLFNQLELEWIQAGLEVAESRERMATAAKSLESAQEALRITRVRYEQGAADITDLLTAQAGNTATRTRSVAARYDHAVALSNEQRARGAWSETEETPSGDTP